jgi:hypothetical protein
MNLARVGRCIVALGIIGIVRVIPEMLQLSRTRPLYWMVAILDVAFAVLMILAGEGLRREKDWGSRWAPRVAGLVLGTSLGWGVLLTSDILRNFAALHGQWMILAPRLFFYLIAIAFLPYGARVMIRSASSDMRRSRMIGLAEGMTLGIILMGVLYFYGRP